MGAIEAGRSASGLDNRQTTEQWWGEGSVSGTQRRRPASGSHTDSLQPDQQQQQRQQQQLQLQLCTPSLSQVTPSAGSSVPPLDLSLQHTPSGRSSTQCTPRIRNLLPSEDSADSTPTRMLTITNLLPTG